MNAPYAPSQAEIDAGWPSASRRIGYPPIREHITITLELHPHWKSFVRLRAIPEHVHEAVRQLSTGSTCPAVDEERDTFYAHDVYRWLRAIGIQAEFVEP
jgi:hypothetical protein